MNIYLDDNRTDRSLAGLLRRSGHTVTVPLDVGLSGRTDASHLEHAARNNLAMLTADRNDFAELHQLVLTTGGHHPGIMVVRYDNDAKRDMKPKHIAAAVDRLERSGLDISNQVVVLNHWR